MANFMLLIYSNAEAFGAAIAEGADISGEYAAYTETLREAGAWVAGDGLQGTDVARTVSAEGVTDGPYTEVTEHLAGYYMIDVPTLDEAVEWATRCPAAKYGTIDVRPLAEVSR